MKSTLKRLAATLPLSAQQVLKRAYFTRKVRRHCLDAGEREFEMLDRLVAPGDWVLDVGANVGAYTVRLSQLVGASGRVIAMEPVMETFELLCSNVRTLPDRNVTLLNVAASDQPALAAMEVPILKTGLANNYEAHLKEGDGVVRVLCLAIDDLCLPRPLALVKIDAEGHEMRVLAGMRRLLVQDRPALIVEASTPKVIEYLEPLGYDIERLPGSPNYLCMPAKATATIDR